MPRNIAFSNQSSSSHRKVTELADHRHAGVIVAQPGFGKNTRPRCIYRSAGEAATKGYRVLVRLVTSLCEKAGPSAQDVSLPLPGVDREVCSGVDRVFHLLRRRIEGDRVQLVNRW
jgi:hypothetical protein